MTLKPVMIALMVAGLAGWGIMAVAFLAVLLSLAYERGEARGARQQALAIERAELGEDGSWAEGVHNGRIRKLAGRLGAGGYVWRSEAGDQSPANNPEAWAGGQILNIMHPHWVWQLTREELPAEPEIFLGTVIDEPGLLQEIKIESGLREWERFDSELPAGSLQTLQRLAHYAYECYEEDHVGRQLAPGQTKGTATIGIRRKYAPQHYDLEVTDRCGAYQATVAIGEFPPAESTPRRHVVNLYLRKP